MYRNDDSNGELKSRADVERERVTRRQALRKLGIGSGMTLFLMLGADDLVRLVGKRLQQKHYENELVDQVATELRSTGVAFAATSPYL